MKKLYFDIHVFFSRTNGYSVPLEVDIEELLLGYLDEDIIQLAIDREKLESDDAKCVDYVKEIDEEQYNKMK